MAGIYKKLQYIIKIIEKYKKFQLAFLIGLILILEIFGSNLLLRPPVHDQQPIENFAESSSHLKYLFPS